MEHFVAYHSIAQMGRPLQLEGTLNFVSRKVGHLKKALGNTVWVVQGSPARGRTEYELLGAYIAKSLHEESGASGAYRIGGAEGVEFQPPVPLNDLPWFPSLRKSQGNFGLGFNRLGDGGVIEALIALRDSLNTPAPPESYADVDFLMAAPEGASLLVHHLHRERSRKLVAAKKASVMATRGSLACEACGFDFRQCYGTWGEDFCEVHHKKPIFQSNDSTVTTLEDLAIVCSNCHRIIHLRRPMPSVEELAAWLLKEGTRSFSKAESASHPGAPSLQ